MTRVGGEQMVTKCKLLKVCLIPSTEEKAKIRTAFDYDSDERDEYFFNPVCASVGESLITGLFGRDIWDAISKVSPGNKCCIDYSLYSFYDLLNLSITGGSIPGPCEHYTGVINNADGVSIGEISGSNIVQIIGEIVREYKNHFSKTKWIQCNVIGDSGNVHATVICQGTTVSVMCPNY